MSDDPEPEISAELLSIDKELKAFDKGNNRPLYLVALGVAIVLLGAALNANIILFIIGNVMTWGACVWAFRRTWKIRRIKKRLDGLMPRLESERKALEAKRGR